MSETHIHLTDEQAFELSLGAPDTRPQIACAECAAAVAEHARLMTDLKETSAVDPAADLGDWEAVLMRRRIREAIEREPAYARSWAASFLTGALPKPLFAGALAVALAALGGWPLLREAERNGGAHQAVAVPEATLPAWTALPAIDEDDSFDVFSAWTPTDDEIDVAGCSSGLCDSELAIIESDARRGALIPNERDRT
jgi:hypothetical protein